MDPIDRADLPSYGRCFASLALGLAPLFIVFGIAAMFGYDTVRVNREAIHGPLAMVYSAAMVVFLAAVLAAFQKLGYAMIAYRSARPVVAED